MKRTLFFLLVTVTTISCTILHNVKNIPQRNTELSSIKYTNDSCYARGIFVDHRYVYTSNSNGKIYKYHFYKMETEEISFPNEKIQELRDIHFFRNEILAMQSGSTGLIIHSSKNINFIEKTSKWENVFLDGFDVKDSIAFMMGDPINGFFSLYKNVSNKWELCEGKIAAIEGEAGFAASGTNVQIVNDSTFIFVSGGAQSRFFKTMNQGKTWTSISLPFDKGDGIGAFSVHFKDNLNGVIVGGNYLKPTETIHTSFYTKDGGLTWNLSKTNVNGYRSAVCYFNKRYYACGTNGIDFSKDNGKTWEKLSDGNYFAIYPIQQNGSSRLFATTTNGTVKVFKIK